MRRRILTLAGVLLATVTYGAQQEHGDLEVTPAVTRAAARTGLQTNRDPWPTPIEHTGRVITVGLEEFAVLPDSDGQPAHMMLLLDEPGAGRLFVNDIRGVLYGVSYTGTAVTPYLDLGDPRWALDLDVGSFRAGSGFQSFAFHPQFNDIGTAGFGRFYTLSETRNTVPTPDFAVGSDARWCRRPTRFCWSGRPASPRPPPTMAARRASCCG